MTELPGLRLKVNEVMFPREAKWRVLLFKFWLNRETMELQQINLITMTEEAISSDLQTIWKKSSRKADVCNSENTCCTRHKHLASSATKKITRSVPNLLLPSY
jgi:hypothetical protein